MATLPRASSASDPGFAKAQAHAAESESATWQVLVGDARERLLELPAASVRCCVTSPPYFGLRDYGVDGQLGLERDPGEYVTALVETFREVRRVLHDDGTLWLNLGDSYAARRGSGRQMGDRAIGSPYRVRLNGNRPPAPAPQGDIKDKDLLGIPWMVAFALRADGWWLRQEIIWHKRAPMPESVKDRCTRAHEQVFMLAKSKRYFYDDEVLREDSVKAATGETTVGWDERKALGEGPRRGESHNAPKAALGSLAASPAGRNRRSVWTLSPEPCPEAHFAVMPTRLARDCILAGSREGDVVLDPFSGAGTTGLEALRRGRSYIGVELNPAYAELQRRRIVGDAPLLNGPAEIDPAFEGAA